ncbi:MAG: amidohydrolase family protein [Bacteroidales bacterium]
MKSIANQIHISKLFRNSLAMLVIIFLAGSELLAQTPAPPQQQPIAITGGTIHTVTNGVIIDGTVLFDNGRIIAVGTDVTVPENAEVIDASGKHVYPGLIHGQSTLGLTEIGRIAESTDLAETGNINPNIRAQVAYHSISEHIPVAALNGVTTVVPTPGGSLISGKPAAMMTDGWTWEQMTLREGIAMTINWPSMRDSDQYREDVEEIQQAFDKARRYQTARLAMEAGEGPHHPFDIRWEAMLPVLEGEMPVLVNVGDLRQIQAAIAWTEKENLDVILAGSRDFGLVADQLAEKGIPVMLTSIISGPDTNWEAYDQGYSNPRKLYEAGVDFLIAGENSAAYAYRLPHHAASAVAFGLPEEEALKSITINAARILGIDDLVGSIEAGKDATLMITTGNPLELWTSNEQVFIQGRKLEMMDKHHRLYERYKEKHRQEQL